MLLALLKVKVSMAIAWEWIVMRFLTATFLFNLVCSRPALHD